MPTTNNDNAAAWAFIHTHRAMMDRLAGRFAARLPREHREEWMQDVIVRVAERFPHYDPDKSAPVTWISWQMRAVTTTWTRRYKKQVREGVGVRIGSDDDSPLVLLNISPGERGSAEAMERAADAPEAAVAHLYAQANEEQRIAIRTFLAGMNATELRKRHGMTGRERTAHLRDLRAHLEMP